MERYDVELRPKRTKRTLDAQREQFVGAVARCGGRVSDHYLLEGRSWLLRVHGVAALGDAMRQWPEVREVRRPPQPEISRPFAPCVTCVTCGGQGYIGDGGYIACPTCHPRDTESEA